MDKKYDKVVSGGSFKGDPNRFKKTRDDNALGFGWRPGRPKESVLVENCTIDANGNAKSIIIAGFIPFVCEAVKTPKLTHLSAHTVSELPACSKHAQNTAHNTAKIKIDPILLATAA